MVEDGAARQGRPAARRVGSVRDADRHRGRRLREVRRHRRRRHDAGAARRGHRPRRARRSSSRKDADSAPAHHAQGRRRQHRQARRAVGDGREARYFLPVGANIFVNDGDDIEAGDVIAKISRETTKTKDITGGLPARRRAVRGAQAEGSRGHLRDRRRRVTSARTRRASARSLVVPEVGDPARVPDPARASTSRSAKATASARARR